jgi:cell wall surface anchor family protein
MKILLKICSFLLVAGVMAGCSKNDGEDNGEPWNPGLLATDPVPSKAFDPLFYIWCIKKFDKNGDGILQYWEIMSIAEVVANYSGDKDNAISHQITSLKGIEYFTGLKRLYWYGECNLSSVDLSKNILLEDIFLLSGKLTILDVSKNTVLERLWCKSDGEGTLAKLVLGKNHLVLKELNCSNNQISSLDVSGCPSLQKLSCNRNKINTLDISNNTKLLSLDCSYNLLKKLDVANCRGLSVLGCFSNQLTELDLSACRYLNNFTGSENPLEIVYVWKGWVKPDWWVCPESTQIIEK